MSSSLFYSFNLLKINFTLLFTLVERSSPTRAFEKTLPSAGILMYHIICPDSPLENQTGHPVCI